MTFVMMNKDATVLSIYSAHFNHTQIKKLKEQSRKCELQANL